MSNLARWLDLIEPTTVLVYISMPGELAAERVVDRVDHHRFATTRTPDEGWLTVHPFDSPRERHRFGYTQPVASSPQVPFADIGVVLVPGLAFDRSGNRVGWGKGYYDRLLAGVEAVKVGVTLERRILPAIETEGHDVAMDLLVTEAGSLPAIR